MLQKRIQYGTLCCIGGFYKKEDNGKKLQTLVCSCDQYSVVYTGPTTGMESETPIAHPKTGDLWLWSSAEVIRTFMTSYKS